MYPNGRDETDVIMSPNGSDESHPCDRDDGRGWHLGVKGLRWVKIKTNKEDLK